jgi:hypothetical protein
MWCPTAVGWRSRKCSVFYPMHHSEVDVAEGDRINMLERGFTQPSFACPAGGTCTAVSPEAALLRRAWAEIVVARERSIALFGPKSVMIQRLYEIACEARESDEEAPVAARAVQQAAALVRALPEMLPLPEVAIDPDGDVSLDWVASQPRMFSVSVGETHGLAYAGIDGTDRGHGVAPFDGQRVPAPIISWIEAVMRGQTGEREPRE